MYSIKSSLKNKLVGISFFLILIGLLGCGKAPQKVDSLPGIEKLGVLPGKK